MAKSQVKARIYKGWWRPSRLFLLVMLGWLAAISWPIPGWQEWYLKRITPDLNFDFSQTIELVIVDKPTNEADLSRYIGRTSAGWFVEIVLPRYPTIKPGTLVQFAGQFQPISRDDRTYELAMAAKKRFAKLVYPKILNQRPAKLNAWQRLLIKARQHFNQTIDQLFTQPQAALFAGLIAGIKTDLPLKLLIDFKIVGLSHIIAVSGFNVTIIIKLLTSYTQRFGRLANFCLVVLAILGFVVFTGASASVVRAGLLAGLFVLARTIGRSGSMLRLLIFAAFAMSLQNPLITRYDIGFQLSFGAVLGLMLFAQPIQDRLASWHCPNWLAEVMAATMAAQITTFPIMGYHFQSFSLYSLPANILVGPLIPLLTALGIPLILLVSLLPFLHWLSYPFDLALRYIILIAQKLAQLPYARLALPALPAVAWLSYYPLISNWHWAQRSEKSR